MFASQGEKKSLYLTDYTAENCVQLPASFLNAYIRA